MNYSPSIRPTSVWGIRYIDIDDNNYETFIRGYENEVFLTKELAQKACDKANETHRKWVTGKYPKPWEPYEINVISEIE